MNHHLEVIIPPGHEPWSTVFAIMRPFEIDGADDDCPISPDAFWDCWCVGGWWSGSKLLSRIPKQRLAAFLSMLDKHGIGLQPVQGGKPKLRDPRQRADADRLWKQAFPDSRSSICPIVEYEGYPLEPSEALQFGDLMRLADAPKRMRFDRVIIAAPSKASRRLDVVCMATHDLWSGLLDGVGWDGTLSGCLRDHARRLKRCEPELAERIMPTGDWLVATIDYGSPRPDPGPF